MKKILTIGSLLALTVLFPGTSHGQFPGTRGLFLASTGPKSAYSKSFWWELNAKQLDLYLNRLQKAGINELYPCAYGHGNYFFKTTHAAFPKGVIPERLGTDPLASLIREAHQRDMRVVPFFPFLVAGGEIYVKQAAGGTLPNPAWYCLDTNGNRGSTLSFDPANPDVRDYLNRVVEDLLDYEIDGLMLDYIRYLGTHMGYTPLARAAFKDETGVDPLELYSRPETFSSNIVYCLKPDTWAGKDWYLSSLLGLLNQINAPFKVVPQVADIFSTVLAGGTILIASYYDIAAETIQKLNAFVKDGGNVIFLDAPTTAMKKHTDALGPVLGMTSRSRYAAPQQRNLQIEEEHAITQGMVGGTLTCSANSLTEIDPATAKVLARFENGTPAVILNAYGKGRATILNFQMLVKYDGAPGVDLLRNTVRWLLAGRSGEQGSLKLAKLNAAWTRWRCKQVTDVVKTVRDTMEARRPNAILSAATTPREAHVNLVFQDWKTWIRREYVDAVYPMDYFGNANELREALAWQCAGIPKSRIVPILALYRREGKEVLPITPETLTTQLNLVRDFGFAGVSMFSGMRLSPELEGTLTARTGE
ncbi:MAG: family 10 glycosylhydrolase [Lentisphaerae bacterium]|jgi:uncharacterized lipoprotein YddW (UPF0748 family)|nr:family 10 glycosylhydrolase [Lentisphaerota bacterium]MBT5609334.1 family 10 glycosylhydrolase [Lentisphaerota bacterium]MBT7054734.1 family 10 glycosylhydrolase [Lentisphaerota bacterium]MBT7847953.1 family 10 glycosylhydrolase [Lentisphaerota bacterium]